MPHMRLCGTTGGLLLIITFANSKGGVGKSTACISIAGAYAKAGSRVHICDLDGNKTVSRWLADEATRPTNITVSKPDPEALTEHLQQTARDHAPDFCFIDIAGVYETALTFAIGRADLTIIPVCPSSEADIFEARKVAKHIEAMSATFPRRYLYRVLATKVSTLPTFAQGHGFKEIRRFQLPLFATTIAQRTAYEEVGYSGRPPHFAEPIRGTTTKAIAELDRLKRELDQLLNIAEMPADFNPRAPADRMTQNRPNFRQVPEPDIPDEELANFSQSRGVPSLTRPASKIPPTAAQFPTDPPIDPPRSPTSAEIPAAKNAAPASKAIKAFVKMSTKVPAYVNRAVNLRAAQEDCTSRHLVLLGLKAIGIPIDEADLIPDERRPGENKHRP